MRDAVNNGSELLTTITNDGWYGQSSAPYQHFEMAAMRAIEQGRCGAGGERGCARPNQCLRAGHRPVGYL